MKNKHSNFVDYDSNVRKYIFLNNIAIKIYTNKF